MTIEMQGLPYNHMHIIQNVFPRQFVKIDGLPMLFTKAGYKNDAGGVIHLPAAAFFIAKN